MNTKIYFAVSFLSVLLFLTACAPSSDTIATLVAVNIYASETSFASIPSATFSPSPTGTPTPTLSPSPVASNTPKPTLTLTPTPMPLSINADNGAQLTMLDSLTGFEGVAAIFFSPGGVTAVRVSEENNLQKTDIQVNFPIGMLGQETWTFAGTAFSADGTMYVSQSRDDNGYGLTVWEVKDDLSLQPLARNFSGYTLEGFYMGFSGDGEYLFSVSFPQPIFTMPSDWKRCAPNCEVTSTYRPTSSGVFQLPSGQLISKLEISSVDSFEYKEDFSPGNTYLATVSHRTDANINVLQYIQLWQVSDGSLYRYLDPMRYEGHNGEDANLVFSPNGMDLAFICGARLRVWQWETNSFRWSADGIFSALDYSPDSSMIATGKPDGSIQLWDAKDGTLIETLQGHDHPIIDMAFSPDGSLLVTMDERGVLRLWNNFQ